jgi:hypothetical protein
VTNQAIFGSVPGKGLRLLGRMASARTVANAIDANTLTDSAIDYFFGGMRATDAGILYGMTAVTNTAVSEWDSKLVS